VVKSWDVIVVGAGIIGLALAIELRRAGMSVLVVEKGEPGREASWAAGGMLADCVIETAAALQPLATASARMYPEFVQGLEQDSGMKIDLRDHGTILFPSIAHIRHPQLRTAALVQADSGEREPALGRPTYEQELELKSFPKERDFDLSDFLFDAMLGPTFYLKERSVDPRHLTSAAIAAARHRGVDFSSGDQVLAVDLSNGKAVGVHTNKSQFASATVVNCAGAWAGQIGPHALPTRPVKGQMLCVAMPKKELVRHVVRTPEVYLIPRSDGHLLIGTTMEEAGFDKQTVPETLQKLRKAALNLVPKLADARTLEAWAGLRPGTPDKLPILGATATAGYYVATGHFRDGILLAPATAKVMGQLMTGQTPQIDLSEFSADRFAN